MFHTPEKIELFAPQALRFQDLPIPDNPQARIAVLRSDLNHSLVSGNKLYKLKYLLVQAVEQGAECIVSFGGPYSNHLHALAAAASNDVEIYAVPVLKEPEQIVQNVGNLLESAGETVQTPWRLLTGYECGGYGRVNEQLFDFIRLFEKKYAVPLEPVYTGKLFKAVVAELDRYDGNTNGRWLVIHCGGLQGRRGFSQLMPLHSNG